MIKDKQREEGRTDDEWMILGFGLGEEKADKERRRELLVWFLSQAFARRWAGICTAAAAVTRWC
jgi:hypothetical protein